MATGRPNIVLFMTDQQCVDSIGAFGNPLAATPNIDALAARGVRFTEAWSQHSACSQSRISMVTGRYPTWVVIGRSTICCSVGSRTCSVRCGTRATSWRGPACGATRSLQG